MAKLYADDLSYIISSSLSKRLQSSGDRIGGPELCEVQACVPELQSVLEYARRVTTDISLFACSLGAYFSLMAYREETFTQALFLSPVVDMQMLIENMMGWFGISEDRMMAEQAIPTPMGKTRYWDYYSYVKANPVDKWLPHTSILRGEKDELSEHDRVASFCRHFGGKLTIMPEGEHFFHTDEQMDFIEIGWRRSLLRNPDIEPTSEINTEGLARPTKPTLKSLKGWSITILRLAIL